MRKLIFLMISSLMFVISSCVNNEVDELNVTNSKNYIGFNSYAQHTTRAAYATGDVDNTVIKTGTFGVVGYKTDDKNLYLGSTSKAVEQTFSNGTSWEYATDSEKKLWPSCAMDFFAYFPYVASGNTFGSTNDATPVMTINNVTGTQDVLYAVAKNITKVDRVGLDFKHALSKIKEVNVSVTNAKLEVEISNIEFVNVNTKGSIKVDGSGNVTYSNVTTNLSKAVSPAKTAKVETPAVTAKLFDNDANAYLFPTNGTAVNKVTGTNVPLWNGSKTLLDAVKGTKTLETESVASIKLTAKVKYDGTYILGSSSAYDVMYVPMCGTTSNVNDITALTAGKRYIYNIVMENNCGYDVDGDPIFQYILFSVNSVASWEDVTVTITL